MRLHAASDGRCVYPSGEYQLPIADCRLPVWAAGMAHGLR
ncbi:hypothetical protein PXO_05522 [Xanthomonas oryzae pv. oryzae PXO99A]|uniref:Uncharacterized protein n=1 Tax=Xanthomonas oryzae pv. oryzae (strain PXO99A) TaxID=360094 RepID=A0A0K0GIE0_XANOP|nr:hypothetical protein PXO_05522 [Xanthomonas oryzae pv. oryzae PXO99A]